MVSSRHQIGKGLVLVVDDNVNLSRSIVEVLETDGYDADCAHDGEHAKRLLTTSLYDVVLLDRRLPGCSGLDVCRELRRRRSAACVIIVSAGDTLQERLDAFKAGTDDFIGKPFYPQELLARISAMIRQTHRWSTTRTLRVADLQMDLTTHTVSRAGRYISLAPHAFRVLEVLLRESPRVVSRRQLEQALWGSTPPDSDSLRSHIYGLRKAIDRTYERKLIHTINRNGYRVADRD